MTQAKVLDLEACELSYRFYGGRAGQKVGILIDGAAWIDLAAIDVLIDEVPEEAYGRVLMTDAQRVSHKRLLRMRYERGIVPAADRVRELGLDESRS